MDRSSGAREVQAGGEGRRWLCAEIKRGHIMLTKKKKQDKVNPTKFYHIFKWRSQQVLLARKEFQGLKKTARGTC